MQPSLVVEAMITTGVRLKRLMECLAACISWENKHEDLLTSVSIDFANRLSQVIEGPIFDIFLYTVRV
jgi:hypothetical protein